MKEFDAKLGYQANSGKPKRSHHKPGPPTADAAPNAKRKAIKS